MKTIFLICLFLALFAVLLYAAVGSETSVDKAKLSARCFEEIKTAQELSFGKICTQEARVFFCPHAASFDYEATNGCEISFLETRGWQ